MKQSKTEGRDQLCIMWEGSKRNIIYMNAQTVLYYLRADYPVCCEYRVKNLRV